MATLDPPKINAQEKAYVLAALYALPQILTQEVSAPNSAKTSTIEAFLSTLPTLLQQWMCKQRGQLWGDAGCSSNDLRRAVAHLGGQRMLSQSLLQGMRLKELLLQQLNSPRRWIDFHLAPRTPNDLLLLPTPSPFRPFSSCLCDQFDFSDCWSSYAPDTSTLLNKVPEFPPKLLCSSSLRRVDKARGSPPGRQVPQNAALGFTASSFPHAVQESIQVPLEQGPVSAPRQQEAGILASKQR